jgi:hypothetical protein
MVGSTVPTTTARPRSIRRLAPPTIALVAGLLAAGAFAYQVAAGGELFDNYLVVDVVLTVVSSGLGAFLWSAEASSAT